MTPQEFIDKHGTTMTECLYTRLESLGYTEYEIEAAEDALEDIFAVRALENFRRMLEILRTVR